jgi:hypothetical protein
MYYFNTGCYCMHHHWQNNAFWAITFLASGFHFFRFRNNKFLQSKIVLTVSRPACSSFKHPSGAQDQILISVRQFRVRWYGAPSLTRGLACRLQLLLGPRQRNHSQVRVPRDPWSYFTLSESRLPQLGGPGTGWPSFNTPGTGFPFRRLLRLIGLWWRYSNPPPLWVPNNDS